MSYDVGPFSSTVPPLPSSRRLRVLFIPQWYPSADGLNQVTGTFCREHVRAASLYDDVAVLVFSVRQDRWPTLRWRLMNDDGIPTFYADHGTSPIPKTTRPFFYLHLRRAFSRIVEEWGLPDVIHTQDALAYYVMRGLSTFGIPFVISQHWSGFMERIVDAPTARRFAWAFSRAVRVLSVNKFAERDYQHYRLEPSITWLPNVLDTEIFWSRHQSPKEPWVLHASGLTREKRLPDIIQAFGRVQSRHAILHIVGDGPHRSQFESLAKRTLKPSSVRFHGLVAKPQLANLMRRSSGLVMASDAETFGCVLMEAMACGCPVLTTRVGGIPAVVPEGDGLFVEVGNVDQIVNGMQRLLDGTHGLDLQRISRETRGRFSHSTIGRVLHDEHARAAMVNPQHHHHHVQGSHALTQGTH